MAGRPAPTPARYVVGLESPAGGKNTERGMIAPGLLGWGWSEDCLGEAMGLFERVMGRSKLDHGHGAFDLADNCGDPILFSVTW